MSDIPVANFITAPEVAAPPPENNLQKQIFHIAIPPAETAQDSALVSYLVKLVNDVYTEAEAGIFDSAYLRTNAAQITEYLSTGLLALASTSDSSPWSPPSNIKGCIRITKHSPTTGEIGMLVAAPSSRGTGLGRQLIIFSEEHCRQWGASKMFLELLVPTSFRHELKTWVQPWYERLGYKVVGISDFKAKYPRIAESVICETEYRTFEKVL